jgi:hypothetical protein
MRGCLSFLLFTAVLIGVVAWLALRPLAGALIDVGLSASGFHGQNTTVNVAADPPLELVLGRADSVAVESVSVTSGPLSADRLAITLHDVSLVDRSAAIARGTITGVTLRQPTGADIHVAQIDLDGPPHAAEARLLVSEMEVRARAVAALGAAGLAVSDIRLAAPDTLVVTALGHELRATLAVDADGAIGLRVPGFAAVALVAPPPGLPIRFHSVSVEGNRTLLVVATVDLGPLLGA